MKNLKFRWLYVYLLLWVITLACFWIFEGDVDALGYSLFLQCLPLGVVLPFIICFTKARKGFHWSLAAAPFSFCAGLSLHHYFTFHLLNLSSFSTSSVYKTYLTRLFDKDFWNWTLWPTLLGIAIGLLIYAINDIKSRNEISEN